MFAMTSSKNLNVTLIFLLVFFIALLNADLSITTLDPMAELKNFFGGIVEIDISKAPTYFEAILNTIAIAIVAIFVSAILGFFFALYFKYTLVRVSLAFTRAIHELFWALLFLQIFGLNTMTALLAIILPYSATLGKVYAEILEEHNIFPKELEPNKASKVSTFLYTKLPDAMPHLLSYTLYRFECALKSTAILGFVGLTTLGYYLQGSFMQGYYGEVWLILIIFYLIIATIKYWFTKYSAPILLIASFLYLDDFSGFNINNLIRFVTQDIIPSPIRKEQGLLQTYSWFENIVVNELVPGIFNTIVLTQTALIITAVLALIFFPLISKKFVSPTFGFLGNTLLVILRSTPEYILAYLFLQFFGPSMLPAVVALSLHNGAIIGYIMGGQSNELKLRADTTNKKVELYFFEVIPRIYGSFLAFLFYRWEVIMRESAILGILGISTLGFFIDSAIADIRLDKVVILLFFTALLNILVDYISRRVRNYLRLNTSLKSECSCLTLEK